MFIVFLLFVVFWDVAFRLLYFAFIAFLYSLYSLFNIAYYELANIVHLAESAAYCAEGVATFLQLRLPMASYIVALVVASDI